VEEKVITLSCHFSISPLFISYTYMPFIGLLLAQSDLGFISKFYSCAFFVLPYFLLRLKSAVYNGVGGIGVSSLWKIFTIYQTVRCSMWVLRLRNLLTKSSYDSVMTETNS
jgi:hypothetical protein